MVFDIRRYENSTLRLAEFVKEKEAEIILFTDQWQSPVAVLASTSFSNRIVVPSAWDSLITCMSHCNIQSIQSIVMLQATHAVATSYWVSTSADIGNRKENTTYKS